MANTTTSSSHPTGRRLRLVVPAVLLASPFVLVACNHARSASVVSECADDVLVDFRGAPDETWDPTVVTPEGTSLGVSSNVDRVWYESADGEILNEVSLTADELADSDVDFPTLTIRAEHCDQLGSD